MADSIYIPSDIIDKADKYQSLIPQIKALIDGEKDLIANLSNIMAALKYGMNFFWVGCYFVKDNELILGPFQGPVACTRIAFGKGVWKQALNTSKPCSVKTNGIFKCRDNNSAACPQGRAAWA